MVQDLSQYFRTFSPYSESRILNTFGLLLPFRLIAVSGSWFSLVAWSLGTSLIAWEIRQLVWPGLEHSPRGTSAPLGTGDGIGPYSPVEVCLP